MSWFKLRKKSPDIATSLLYDESTFYQAFIADLLKCEKEIIIESPFITTSRMESLYPIFKRILDRRIKIHVITRDPSEHDETFRHQATNEILSLAEIGVNITLLKGNHHRKLAIIDQKITWEGSLNILSQTNSREIMRRIDSISSTKELMSFLKLQNLKNLK